MVATACISNIEKSTTEEDLTTYLQSKCLALSEDHTRVLFTVTEGGYKRTTVSFNDEGTLNRALSLRRVDRKLNGRVLIFDADFEGITIIYEGSSSQVECVIQLTSGFHCRLINLIASLQFME